MPALNQLCLVGADQGSPIGYCSTPDDPSLHITGDIDIRAAFALERWSSSVGDDDFLLTKSTTNGNQVGWYLGISNVGVLAFGWSVNGNFIVDFATSPSVTVVDGTFVTVRVARQVAAGIVTFYQRPFSLETAFADCMSDDDTWKPFAVVTGKNTGLMFSTSADLVISGINDYGAGPSNGQFTGQVAAIVVKSGIAGTAVANPDFTRQALGTTSFVDDAGRTWTLRNNDRYAGPGSGSSLPPTNGRLYTVSEICEGLGSFRPGGFLRQKQRTSELATFRSAYQNRIP